MLKGIAIWLALINLLTYGIYWWDKRRAVKGKRRISERELLSWAAVGGTPAAFFAMRKFRHKTQKSSFSGSSRRRRSRLSSGSSATSRAKPAWNPQFAGVPGTRHFRAEERNLLQRGLSGRLGSVRLYHSETGSFIGVE